MPAGAQSRAQLHPPRDADDRRQAAAGGAREHVGLCLLRLDHRHYRLGCSGPRQGFRRGVRIKRHTKLPVCVGFGVRTGEQARTIAEGADGVVVGSALVEALHASLDGDGKPTATTEIGQRHCQRAGAGSARRTLRWRRKSDGKQESSRDQTGPRLKQQLIVAGKVLVDAGQGDFTRGHISVRLPGDPKLFYMKPHSVGLDEITMQNILTIDLEGNVVAGKARRHSEVYIHSEILKARSDINCVIHAHPTYSVALSASAPFGEGVQPARCAVL